MTAPSASSFGKRLTAEDRARSIAPPGSHEGPFLLVYQFENEQLLELTNRTVHAAVLNVLTETAEGYRFYLAVYVQNVSRLTPRYMAAIDPVRRLFVYPSLLRSTPRAVESDYGCRPPWSPRAAMSELATHSSLCAGLQHLGVRSGDIVMVHAAVSEVGPILGGLNVLVQDPL